jgi:hypothetical protein
MRSTLRSVLVIALPLALSARVARADGDQHAPSQPGKAAAHAALSDGADVPATPPELPQHASDQARRALANAAFGKKGEAARKAHAQADQHGADAAIAAHADAADRAAQGSVAAAARSANADSRTAAAQARASAAKANGSGHPNGTTPNPLTGTRP